MSMSETVLQQILATLRTPDDITPEQSGTERTTLHLTPPRADSLPTVLRPPAVKSQGPEPGKAGVRVGLSREEADCHVKFLDTSEANRQRVGVPFQCGRGGLFTHARTATSRTHTPRKN